MLINSGIAVVFENSAPRPVACGNMLIKRLINRLHTDCQWLLLDAYSGNRRKYGFELCITHSCVPSTIQC